MLINVSNHPSERWPENERQEAVDCYGCVKDYAFPAVDPLASQEDLAELAKEHLKEIWKLWETRDPQENSAVLCQGEFTLTHALTAKLQEFGIPVYAACSERNVIEETDADGNTIRKTVFVFAGFRKYIV